MNPKHPAGPPMTLGNMRELGVQAANRFVPERHLQASGPNRRVRLSG
jgi:hypothetical protein